MKLHVRHPASYSVTFHEDQSIPSYGSVGTDSFKCRQSKGINSCISENIVTNVELHHHTIAGFIITLNFMKFHSLVTRLWF